MTAGNRERGAGGENLRTDVHTFGDRIAHREIDAPATADVAHGGKAVVQHRLCIFMP